MDVGVGYTSDPDDIPGLAHFLGTASTPFDFLALYPIYY